MMAKKSSTKFDMKRMTCLRGSVNIHSTLRNHSWVTLKDNRSIFLLKSSQSHVLWILAKPKQSYFLTKLYKFFREVLELHGYITCMGTSGVELAGLVGSIRLKDVCWSCLLKEMWRPLCHVTRAFRQAWFVPRIFSIQDQESTTLKATMCPIGRPAWPGSAQSDKSPIKSSNLCRHGSSAKRKGGFNQPLSILQSTRVAKTQPRIITTVEEIANQYVM